MKTRPRGDNIRHFILENVAAGVDDIAVRTAEQFGITRQAVGKHIRRLTDEKAIVSSGNTRDRRYSLAPLIDWSRQYQIAPGLEEDRVWSLDIAPMLSHLPRNVLDIWQFCFTEMFNNAMDHSGGSNIGCNVNQTARETRIALIDNGVGIFRKIQAALNLIDERDALLELSKGKLTTDPKNHSGQGIFFTSRMLDSFNIMSGAVLFVHNKAEKFDLLSDHSGFTQGTAILMKMKNDANRTSKEIFDQFSSGENYDFSKTIIPVKLAQYGNDKLVSRSQAKRLLSRMDLFQTVILDFAEVESIGQAFADEIFRVFAQNHPNMLLISTNATDEVRKIVASAEAAKRKDQQTKLIDET